MFSDALPLPSGAALSKNPSVTISEVIPAAQAEHCACSYCGKDKLAAFHLVTDDAREGVVCYPCADQGMNWLERNFPGPSFERWALMD